MADVHLLTPGELRQVSVVCGARLPELGTWDHRAVTCPRCLAPSRSAVHASCPTGLSEKAWLQQVRSLAHTHRWMTYHTLQSKGSEPGWVDLVLLRGPTLVCAELKTDHGRLTPAQRAWLDALAAVTTVQVHVWRPEDWDKVVETLR